MKSTVINVLYLSVNCGGAKVKTSELDYTHISEEAEHYQLRPVNMAVSISS